MPVAETSSGGPNGYVRLWRQLLENPVWTQLSPAVLKVMIAFLLRANWKTATWYDGSAEVTIPRGSFVTSYPRMARFCNLSTKQIRSAFAHLERVHFAAYQRAPKWTLVTVLNYSSYQDASSDEGTVEGAMRARSGHDEGTMRAPIEESKKERSYICASPKNGNARRCNPSNALLLSSQQQDEWFEQWWPEYFLHKAKRAARDAFMKHVRTEARFREVMTATRAQKAEMLAREPGKRPHGATWLNGERWTDELLELEALPDSLYTPAEVN